ncbi:MAG: response regulator transcription factor [Scytonema sp. PMC 1069.18]|nr:response regulator transcription factor [Scytonema sp. PMC 1069.18]MEC4881143.1 response regulator transcription factor [Scytonema sp. PMC 1070.18]
MRILVVEDDLRLAAMLQEALITCQYVVDIAQDGEAAWDWVRAADYDLIVLDVTLPRLNGINFCQRLRSQNTKLPVLMLTARDMLSDKVMGLDAGADDYMVKPFEMPELMARVRALLRRGSTIESPSISWGSLLLNASTHEAIYGNQLVILTPKEYALLELLISNGRRVLSRSRIIERVWSLDDAPSEETVRSHIRGLRHKLKEAGAPEDLIETVHSVGYRLKQV